MTAPLNETPASLSKPKRRWGRFFFFGALLLLFLFVRHAINSTPNIELEVQRTDSTFRNDGQAIQIVNIGTKPLTVTKVIVNDRPDCPTTSAAEMLGQKPTNGYSLNIGDKLFLRSTCQVVRATIETDQGSATYSFNR